MKVKEPVVYAVLRSPAGTPVKNCFDAAKIVHNIRTSKGEQVFHIEITTTADRYDVICNKLTEQGIPNGIGTVTSGKAASLLISQLRKIPFMVGPNLSEGVMLETARNNITIVPGVANPDEISRAVNLGAREVKIFPSTPANSTEFLDAVNYPFKNEIKFLRDKGWPVVSDLDLNASSKKIVITTPTELYNLYKYILECDIAGSHIKPYAPIVIKLEGASGLDRLRELSAFAKSRGAEVVASGIEGPNRDKNIKEILGNNIAGSVALGGIFSSANLTSNNIDAIAAEAEKVVEVIEKI